MFGVKFVVVVQKDGLDEKGFKETLAKYGKVFEEQDDMLNEDTPVKMYFVDGELGDYLKIQWEMNCVQADDNKYVLFPMANLEEKMAVLSARKA